MKSYKVEELKTRLDKFLATASGTSRSQIQRDIEAGRVSVNGTVEQETDFVVRKGDIVNSRKSIVDSQQSEPVSRTPLKILYNNHGLLIIDKPAGLAVHPGAGFKGETLASALLYEFKDIHLVGEEGRSGIVHRLDKDTSGVMLVALTQDMYEHLKDAFSERKIKKQYIALVSGRVEKQHGFINSPIGRSKTDFRKYSTKNMLEAKDSLTEYQVLEYLKKTEIDPSTKLGVSASENRSLDECTLILVKLHTGRTHQIRVHMQSIGHPLMGDTLYGNSKTKLVGLKRQFLHASTIEVQLPDKTWIEADSKLPNDLKETLIFLKSKSVNNL